MPVSEGEDLRQDYYRRTAADYARLHEGSESTHDRALALIVSLLPGLGATSVLDVGTGTGRAIRWLRREAPNLRAQGLEPVPELILEAEKHGVPPGTIVHGSGEQIPFPDDSFDVVTSFGVLHHVPKPNLVVSEMLRVAKRAVFISDSNRFGQGSPLARYVKLALDAAGLWRAFDIVRTRGKGYMVSEGDGVYYSYSVYDSMALLRARSKRIMTMELECDPRASGIWSSSISNASSVLIGAFKDPT